jgi:hypothetical protein
MAFGNSAPPATAKQVQYLLSLVQKAGHESFRDARYPLGLTQRQASGKFSKTEASALIDRLLADPTGGAGPAAADDADGPSLFATGEQISAAERLETERAEMLRGMPAGLLAAELERRGWQVAPPA